VLCVRHQDLVFIKGEEMSTFVLVHGGWSGSHGFRHIRKLLQAEGHEVFTPCLTGIGERSHLASPLINLSTHVLDVVNHVIYEDLNDIVLVGFSYGGFVVTASLEHISNRVKHLVYLDAFVPKDGESVSSLAFSGAGRPSIEIEAPWTVPPVVREFDDKSEGEWMGVRRTPHPMGCFSEPVFLKKPLENFDFSRTYIKASRNPSTDVGADALWQAGNLARDSLAWEYREIETTHMVASNEPMRLLKLLCEVVARDA
jgi:pimeloyl-ACP methyl ester carboxylesterase